ncbi:hypothetical protein [Levilactobacillus fuyuanensis]|uniref:Uncharacterized protein n=1 Tax=Levilactobacillus fuyuanensis TaxID=2486022 RepID=A0ABW4H2Q4_9LACO|nr:hypothetical protein [Levilactobacillus fuyuanensis]
MYKYFHLIVISQFGNQALAYHYASLESEAVSTRWDTLMEKSKVQGPVYSLHMVKSASPDFKGIQERDPYFQKFEVFEDLDEFLDTVYHLAQKTNAI